FSCTDLSTTQIYTLSLHDALPIFWIMERNIRGGQVQAQIVRQSLNHFHRPFYNFHQGHQPARGRVVADPQELVALFLAANRKGRDRKSTRLNSSHRTISYAVFCLK